MTADEKIPLPTFLKMLSSTNLPMAKSMTVASKIYKTHNTPAALQKLTDSDLSSFGVDKEDRKLVIAAVKKAGYKKNLDSVVDPVPQAGSSTLHGKSSKRAKTTRKRKRDDDLNDGPLEGPRVEGSEFGSFDFEEVLDEEILKSKTAVVNRAPVMSAWATIVAERLGFGREEALSIASAYTEMNAISKGVSIGVFDQSRGKGIELKKGESQPYVDIMGRRPLYKNQNSQWRALIKGEPVDPTTAYGYMQRSFRQTRPYVLGALRLLANSFHSPAALNTMGFSLYAEFRPECEGWGARGELSCEKILGLRRKAVGQNGGSKDGISRNRSGEGDVETKEPVIEMGDASSEDVQGAETAQTSADEEARKKVKTMTVEEYEAALDASLSYDDLDEVEGL